MRSYSEINSMSDARDSFVWNLCLQETRPVFKWIRMTNTTAIWLTEGSSLMKIRKKVATETWSNPKLVRSGSIYIDIHLEWSWRKLNNKLKEAKILEISIRNAEWRNCDRSSVEWALWKMYCLLTAATSQGDNFEERETIYKLLASLYLRIGVTLASYQPDEKIPSQCDDLKRFGNECASFE